MISIKKKSLYLWESLEFVVDLSTAHQLQLSSTELLSCLLIPCQLSLFSVSFFSLSAELT